ncbi:MAG: FkbM family methyltransferase [Cyanobacteriota bacterium]|nr:FkbM family methyltransferase [Cyanobacteriota bacterium]
MAEKNNPIQKISYFDEGYRAQKFAQLHQKKDVFFVQVGGMDGKQFDPIYPAVQRYGWSGLIVEPLPDLYALLCQTYQPYPQIILEACAITESSGWVTMHRIPLAIVEDGSLPDWTTGIASVREDENRLGGIRKDSLLYEKIQPYLVQEQVVGLTLAELLVKHHVKQMDVLQIDAEGMDYHILKQLDFSTYQPYLINLEFANLPESEQLATLDLLEQHGYRYRCEAGHGLDLLAERLLE